MIYKRHLLVFGPKGTYLQDRYSDEENKKFMGMGEDEKKEAIPKDAMSPRTWWRKWLKIE